MLNTNCERLAPEIMDVIRLFGAENENFTHYFSYADGEYFNSIEYNGNFYDYRETQTTADEVEYKRYARRFSKLAFYKTLSKVKNIDYPYGALTGIRPTKLAYAELAAGRDFKPLFEKLCVSGENISFVGKVIETQRGIYGNKGGQSLFISLPFCPTKCEYCSFITAPITATRDLVDPYISCLGREIESAGGYLTDVRSVYIGGGTPFAITAEQLARVLEAVKGLSLPEVEYTVEAGRPDTFTDEKLALCKDYGVNRICVNPQSFKDETLVKIGRRHTAEQTLAAYETAKGYGFDINIDLIAGLADETAEDFAKSLDIAISLDPANITVHTLCLKSGAKLKENCGRLRVEGIGEMIALSREKLFAAGYAPYYTYRQKYQAGGHENCGWCKGGKASVYNVTVMEEISDNVALGANAVSKRIFSDGARIERYATPKDIRTYLSKLSSILSARTNFFTSDR